MKLRYFIYFFLAFLSVNSTAQDVHYSYYQFAPTIVNPAFTGAFYGNIRATAIHRGQWFNVHGPEQGRDGFTSTSILIDGNLPFGFKEGDWVSAGINMLVEGNTAGVFDLKRKFNGLSVAYHLSLSKKKQSVLTTSIKYGTYGVTLNENEDITTSHGLVNSAAIGDDQDYIRALGGAMEGRVTDDTNDWMVGLMLTTPAGDNADMRVGVSMDHLLRPRLKQDTTGVGGPQTGGERLDRRLNAFVQYYVDINNNMTFNPSVVYQSIGKASNILVQGLMSYTSGSNPDMTFNFGLGVRLADNMDVPIYLGVDYKDWRVGIAFDTNISGLTQATNNAGAYELAVSRIFSWNKKAKVKPKFICPRL